MPAQVQRLEQSATSTVAQAPASTASLDAFAAQAAELLALTATADQLADVLNGDSSAFPLLAYSAARLTDLRYRVELVQRRLDTATTTNTSSRTSRQKALEADAKRAAEEAARKAAAEKAAADAAARAAQVAQQSRPWSSGSTSHSSSATHTSAPTKSSSGSGSSTYTGCRSYAPGGKTWTPIPCPNR